MHAKADNPELLKAQELGLKIILIQSFIRTIQKIKRELLLVVHGKTTITSMIFT
jgi:UDP-N-acetylmuramate: L-alanyl-gamma-D-glutamyl-meso-diaminopimelate ligase